MMHAALFLLLTVITVFGVVGVILMVRALREDSRETSFLEPVSTPRSSSRARVDRRASAAPPTAGHITTGSPVAGFRGRWSRLVRRTYGDVALLGPRRRVLFEFLGAACGFPGLGWILSGRVALGMTLLVGCPAVVWAVLPMSLSVVGQFGLGLTFRYLLPVLACASAGALAFVERRDSFTGPMRSADVATGKHAVPPVGPGAVPDS
jgi:hypothetical protein